MRLKAVNYQWFFAENLHGFELGQGSEWPNRMRICLKLGTRALAYLLKGR